MKEYKCILFDLDGTLTDPKLGITKSVNYALEKFGLKTESLDDLEKFIGPPLHDSFPLFYGFDHDKTELAVSFFREYFAEKGIFENSIYSGIKDLLKHLTNQGIELIVATSKPQVFAKKIIEHFDLEAYFTKVEGSRLNGELSNKGELIKYILKDLNYNNDEILMVGDRKHDIIGAKSNNLDTLGVEYGYAKGNELKEAGATYIAKDMDSLLELFSVNIHQ